MVKKILLGLVVFVGLFLVVVAMQSNELRVVRSATIDAPPAEVFAQVNDLHQFQTWSPWAKLDPELKGTYEGAENGTGAIYKWAGNDQVGEGQMTIVESKPAELVRFKLEFFKPFAATNMAAFSFKPEGEKTVVTWEMDGQKNFICKGFGLFMDMEKMCGDDFEKGLANMKTIVEGNKPAAEKYPAEPATPAPSPVAQQESEAAPVN